VSTLRFHPFFFFTFLFLPWQCNNASLGVPKKKSTHPVPDTPTPPYVRSKITTREKKTAAAGMHISLSQMAKLSFFENPPRYPIIHPICG